MKKFFLISLLWCGVLPMGQQVFGQADEDEKIEQIKKDPDWQLMTKIQDYVINSFVSARVDISKFDFNNENLFLKTINMTKEQYQQQAQLNREAAKRLLMKFDVGGGKCVSCDQTYDEKVKTLKTTLVEFQNNPAQYLKFRTETLGIQKGQAQAVALRVQSVGAIKGQNLSPVFRCCGFWFYACCFLCAASIEAFPVYLMCAAHCFHLECCNSAMN